MELFADLRQGTVWETLGEEGQQAAAEEREIGQEIGITTAGAIFPHEHIAPPVIADFHPAPVAASERQPLVGAVLFRGGAGKIIVRFGGRLSGLFDRPFVMLNDQGACIGEIRRQRFNGEGMEPPEVNPSVSGLEIGKKGVSGSASKLWACLKSRGWLPLI